MSLIERSVFFSLHLHNIKLGEKGDPEYVDKFGFHAKTCCGYLPQGNAWDDDWPVSLYQLNLTFISLVTICTYKPYFPLTDCFSDKAELRIPPKNPRTFSTSH